MEMYATELNNTIQLLDYYRKKYNALEKDECSFLSEIILQLNTRRRRLEYILKEDGLEGVI